MSEINIKLGATWGRNRLAGRVPGRGPVRIYLDTCAEAAFVEPPVVRILRRRPMEFEMRGDAQATFLLPPGIFLDPETNDPVTVLKLEAGQTRKLLVASDTPDLGRHEMFAYTVAVAAPPLAMKALGNSPPGMVIDDPDGERGRNPQIAPPGDDPAVGPDVLLYEMPVIVPYNLQGTLRRKDDS